MFQILSVFSPCEIKEKGKESLFSWAGEGGGSTNEATAKKCESLSLLLAVRFLHRNQLYIVSTSCKYVT